MHQYRGLMCREDRRYNSVTLVWVRMCVRNIQCIDWNKTTELRMREKEKEKKKGEEKEKGEERIVRKRRGT
jgi:hypothetical protein